MAALETKRLRVGVQVFFANVTVHTAGMESVLIIPWASSTTPVLSTVLVVWALVSEVVASVIPLGITTIVPTIISSVVKSLVSSIVTSVTGRVLVRFILVVKRHLIQRGRIEVLAQFLKFV